MMFEQVEGAPPDSILGLIGQFRADPSPNKVDLGVGVYRDEHGNTPVMRAVKLAEQELVRTERTKAYIGQHGDPAFGDAIARLVLGAESTTLAEHRVSATQTPGGSGALRVAAELLAIALPTRRIWVPDPTYANHPGIFGAAGLQLRRYPYVDATGRLDFRAMREAMMQIPAGDGVVLHACCHNPTGFDLAPPQWQTVADILAERQLVPLLDIAYQGLGEGLEQDAAGIRIVAARVDGLLIAQSCSKNFGLYRDRTGCLLAVCPTPAVCERVRTRVAQLVRHNYSHPPTHGATVVTTILASVELASVWRDELDAMRERLIRMRRALVAASHGRFSFITEQRGLFSYLGISADAARILCNDYSVYVVPPCRANVAGLNEHNVVYVGDALASVTQ